MADKFYTGQRLSYEGATCTVRYIGQVQGTKGDWLGVEWDDTRRGKHRGCYAGVTYFDCHNPSPTAGSFVRPNRPIDKPIGLLDALRQKYAAQEVDAGDRDPEINISGKTVEEVGFERIARQLANLHELRIVLLDGLRIAGLTARPFTIHKDSFSQELEQFGEQDLQIQELDLSRNLLEDWADVLGICSQLKFLRILKLNGNRFRQRPGVKSTLAPQPLMTIRELGLDETYLSWDEILPLLSVFPCLQSLSLAGNNLLPPPSPLPCSSLEILNLSSNRITTLLSLSNIISLSKLNTLVLRSNPLTSLASQIPFPALSHLDVSSTLISNPTELIGIPESIPALTSVLTSNTRLHALAASNLHTIARISTLTSLNHSRISPQDRTNAELYYLSSIASALSSSLIAEENALLKQHPRYAELCAIHGEPNIVRKLSVDERTKGPKPGSLAARLTQFTFYIPHGQSNGDVQLAETITKDIPRTIGIYALKGIVARLYGLWAMDLRLIWETEEWDPVAGESDGWCVSDDDTDSEPEEQSGDDPAAKTLKTGKAQTERAKTQWVRREVELVDGTKDVGFWIESAEARIRIELR